VYLEATFILSIRIACKSALINDVHQAYPIQKVQQVFYSAFLHSLGFSFIEWLPSKEVDVILKLLQINFMQSVAFFIRL
jgi:hypothetical protein